MTSYRGVWWRGGWAGFQVCPDDDTEERAALQAFRFGWQATPATPQAICPHHCKTGARGVKCIKISELTVAVTWTQSVAGFHLPWPSPQPGTSESDRTGSGSSCACPLGSFWTPDTRSGNPSALCADQSENTQPYHSRSNYHTSETVKYLTPKVSSRMNLVILVKKPHKSQ